MEYKANVIKVILMCLLLCVFVALIIIGQKNIGYAGLGMMIVGLIGILGLLFVYNNKHK